MTSQLTQTTETAVRSHFMEHLRVVESTLHMLEAPIARAGHMMAEALDRGGALLWCGNGGSAADSQHMAAEFVGRFKKNRKPLRSIALSTDTSVLTCIANDFSYNDIFARQVEALGTPQDVLIGISTSGQSENVLRAFKKAKELGVTTIALLGKGGGPAHALADLAIVIPSSTTARIQETHILIGHTLCDLVESELGLA